MEVAREIATRVVDVVKPRVEVLFQGSGTYRGVRFINSWNTEQEVALTEKTWASIKTRGVRAAGSSLPGQ